MPGSPPDSTDRPTSLEVRLAPQARRQYDGLPSSEKEAMRTALLRLTETARSRRRGGKALKTLRGTGGDFHRLRVGEWRVMFDLLPDEQVLLVLGIVNRRDLELWIRTRGRQRRP